MTLLKAKIHAPIFDMSALNFIFDGKKTKSQI